MKMNYKTIGKALAVVAGIVSLGTGAMQTSAGERHRSGTFESSRGASGTFQQEIDWQPGQYSRNTTAQTAGGKVWHRSVQDNWNRQAGTASRSVITTAPNGKTATVNETASHNGNMTTVNGSRTGYDGKTSSWSETVTGNGNGRATVAGQYTLQNGNTINSSSTVTKTANGRDVTGTYATSTGKSGSFDTTVANSDGTRTKTEIITGANRKTAERVATTTRDGDTIEHTVTTTGPNGNTETHSGSATFNP